MSDVAGISNVTKGIPASGQGQGGGDKAQMIAMLEQAIGKLEGGKGGNASKADEGGGANEANGGGGDDDLLQELLKMLQALTGQSGSNHHGTNHGEVDKGQAAESSGGIKAG